MFIVPLSQLPAIAPIASSDITPIAGQQAQPTPSGGSQVPFMSLLKDAMSTMEETRAVSSADNVKLALGDVDNLHQIQINSVKAATATEFAVGLASRAITAYKEVLSMQI